MQFCILGPLQVTEAGRDVELGGPRHRALLATLLVRPREPVATDRLIDVLWGPVPPKSAAEMVHVRISELRRRLRTENGEASIVVRRSPGYLLDVAPDDLDAEVFERLSADGRRALVADDDVQATALLTAALMLWRAEPLPEIADRLFAQPRIAALQDLYLHTVEDAVDADLLAGRNAEAIGRLMKLTAEHPLRERLRYQLMLALYRSGRQGDALAEYERLREMLAADLGIDPGNELQTLQLQILRHDPSIDAPTRSTIARGTPHNLPNLLTSFVGRVSELRGVDHLLRVARLVTIVGVGGAGKSRLAVEAAWAHIDDNPGGVWLIELSPLSDPELVLPTTARVLGVLEHHERDLFDQIVHALRDTTSLLIFDNCEHLIDDVAKLVPRLLQECPQLRIICTSRERLQISGESIHQLSGLTTSVADVEGADVFGTEAVQLFFERARAAKPDFDRSPETMQLVADICRRLDGLPLAIELAAARVGTFSVARIADRLDDRFRLLGVGDRSSSARHRTLRAVVDWSYDLLTDAEKKIFENLAVFVGGFTFEAAETVCASTGEDVDFSYVLDRLVSKSLVHAETTTAPEYRYQLLETLREYGAQKLSDRGQIEALRRKHADYFSALAKRAAEGLRGADQPVWLERLTAERDNLRAVLHWTLSTGRADAAARIAGAIHPFWSLRGHVTEGRRWLEQVLRADGLAPGVRVRALVRLATLAAIQGDVDQAAAACDEARALSRRTGDAAGLSHALQFLAFSATWAGDLDRADELLAEAVSAARDADARSESGWALLLSATVALARAKYEQAVELTRHADAALAAVGDLEAAGWNSLVRGGAKWAMGDLDGSAKALQEGLRKLDRLGAVWGLSQGFVVSGLLLTSRGQYLSAARVMGAADALRDVAGTGQYPFVQAWAVEATTIIRQAVGPDRLRDAWNIGAASDHRTFTAAVLRLLEQS